MRAYIPHAKELQYKYASIRDLKQDWVRKYIKKQLWRDISRIMRYPSVSTSQIPYYMLYSHGEAVPRKKFTVGDNRAVVFLTKPDTCILESELKNFNFINTFMNSRSKINLFLQGRMQYILPHVWSDAYKRMYTAGQKCPELNLEYEGSDGVKQLPSGNLNNKFNKPKYLSEIVKSHPGVYFVFACRAYGPGSLTESQIKRETGKNAPYKKHSHGNRIHTSENALFRYRFVKRKRNNTGTENERSQKRTRTMNLPF